MVATNCPRCFSIVVTDPASGGIYCGNPNCWQSIKREWIVPPGTAPVGPKPTAEPKESEQSRRRRARRLRDEAVALVGEAADSTWTQAAIAAAEKMVQTRSTFTTDDIWEELEGSGLTTHERRAMGAIMLKLRRRGLVRHTDRTRKSSRPVNHYRPLTVWESTLLVPDA